tara:strand:+ start:303 stop:785 length:483 start_codon:yes stop_codon:yes gene_type:complete
MRHLTLLAILSIVGISYSQDLDHFVIGTDGGYARNNQFSLSYTIGEVVTDLGRDTVNNVDLTQGFQQSYISIVSVEDHDLDIDIMIYPNPAVDYLNVIVSNIDKANNYFMYDMSGKLIRQERINDKEFKIGFSALSTGNYMLVFNDEERKLKTIKVQKSY